MLRAPYPESPVLALLAMLFAFIVFLPERFTAADTDDDGYHDVRELVNGCDLFDPASFPTCQHGEVVACSTTEPGYTPAPEPC